MMSLVLAMAFAQEGLTPTDVHDVGEFSASLRFELADGRGDLSGGTFDADLDLAQYRFLLQGAVGIGMGFEVEAGIPYQFDGTLETDGTLAGLPAETEQDSLGFGDLQVNLVYQLLKEDATSPQLIVGALIIAPTGNDKDGRPDGRILGITLDGADAGIGQGVWSYGFGAGISKRFSMVEPYVVASYMIGGERSENGIDEDRADVGTIMVGSEFHVTSQATIDVRAVLSFVAEDVVEDNGVKKKAEAHFDHTYAAQLYINLAPMVTLVAGGGVTFAGDHEIDDTTGFELQDTFVYALQIGLHFNFGGK